MRMKAEMSQVQTLLHWVTTTMQAVVKSATTEELKAEHKRIVASGVMDKREANVTWQEDLEIVFSECIAEALHARGVKLDWW